jgi:VIT1/CCC1 family predicted Fe2+/Mn2+ transporter
METMAHLERHAAHRVGILRASVLGANDGLISTACLILAVAASSASREAILTAGIAGLVAGAVSMALGEYVSVSSQRDAEQADIAKETWELETMPDHELDELTEIFAAKGLPQALAREVAVELTQHDALAIHLAEELGITQITKARPVQAAVSSALAFSLGAGIPLLTAALATDDSRITITLAVVTASLAGLGWTAAKYGRAEKTRPTIRVVAGGVIAMGITIGIGQILGATIA